MEHTLGIASASASAIIVLSFSLFPDLRQLRYIQLVFFVALNDLIASIAISLGHAENGSFVCWFQGITVTLNYLSSVFWTVVISYQVWLVLERKTIMQDMTNIYIICWGLPVVLALLPLSTNTYGASAAFFNCQWCFIADREDSPSWSLSFWAFASFFFWILLSLILTSFFIVRVYFIVKNMADMPEISRYTLRKLVFYPLITLVCWLPACLIYFLALYGSTSQYGKYLANVFALSTATSQGLLNSAVFLANNELVRSKWVSFFTGDFSVLHIQQETEEERIEEERPYSIFSLPDYLAMRMRDTELISSDGSGSIINSLRSGQTKIRQGRQISSDSGVISAISGLGTVESGVANGDDGVLSVRVLSSPMHEL